ncbi:SHOCT domain-containing protein [Shimia sp.]|uniref:SHOCT domain-containing protein n=1 Tax=unclassified Shimia TaxID=2630038 RepID=UPI0025E070B5|nr:SHOCT domain-containing protein [Shimia sp.]MCH2067439.1 SHOCT domain-containing protein [Shimia sp.]
MIDLGSRIVTIDNCLKQSVPIVADLANKLLREKPEPNVSSISKSSHGLSSDPLETLERLGALLERGLLDKEEFTEAKRKLLDAL